MRILTSFVLAAIFGFGQASAEEKAPPTSDFRSLLNRDFRSLTNEERDELKRLVRENTGKDPKFYGELKGFRGSDQELEAQFKRQDRQRAEDVLRRIRERKVEIERELFATRTLRFGLFRLRRRTVWVANGEERVRLEKVRELLHREIERRAAEVARL